MSKKTSRVILPLKGVLVHETDEYVHLAVRHDKPIIQMNGKDTTELIRRLLAAALFVVTDARDRGLWTGRVEFQAVRYADRKNNAQAVMLWKQTK